MVTRVPSHPVHGGALDLVAIVAHQQTTGANRAFGPTLDSLTFECNELASVHDLRPLWPLCALLQLRRRGIFGPLGARPKN
jgi:hypothetical protein